MVLSFKLRRQHLFPSPTTLTHFDLDSANIGDLPLCGDSYVERYGLNTARLNVARYNAYEAHVAALSAEYTKTFTEEKYDCKI